MITASSILRELLEWLICERNFEDAQRLRNLDRELLAMNQEKTMSLSDQDKRQRIIAQLGHASSTNKRLLTKLPTWKRAHDTILAAVCAWAMGRHTRAREQMALAKVRVGDIERQECCGWLKTELAIAGDLLRDRS